MVCPPKQRPAARMRRSRPNARFQRRTRLPRRLHRHGLPRFRRPRLHHRLQIQPPRQQCRSLHSPGHERSDGAPPLLSASLDLRHRRRPLLRTSPPSLAANRRPLPFPARAGRRRKRRLELEHRHCGFNGMVVNNPGLLKTHFRIVRYKHNPLIKIKIH